jgi:putative ABC transport system substrate-binding protein
MRRREFITFVGGAAAVWPLAARAQPERMPRIGVLAPTIHEGAILQGLRELGYVQGRNVVIEYRPTDRTGTIADFAAELVRLNVDVIIATGSQAVRAARQATQSIPIVMTAASDPIGTGFVASLARPGGNVTGNSLLSPELSGKRLALLSEIVNDLSRVAALWNPDDPPALLSLQETEAAARQLRIELTPVEARSPDDLHAAVTFATKAQAQALVILSAPIMTIYAGQIAELVRENRLPAIYNGSEFPKAGGLMSYGPNIDDLCRRGAVYVDKILRGTKPADLPVEQPIRFELVLNLRTAKALGVEIPPTMLAVADEVIE